MLSSRPPPWPGYWGRIISTLTFINLVASTPVPLKATKGSRQIPPPLEWHPNLAATVHDLHLPVEGQSTWLTLSDAPVIRHSKLEQKYQIFQLSQLVDFSNISIAGQNLKTQLDRFSGKTTEVFEGFYSRSTFMFEFYVQHNLSYSQCQTLCVTKNARMAHLRIQLMELSVLTSRFSDYTWIETNQNLTGDSYNVFFDSLVPKMLYPINEYENGSTIVFQLNNQPSQIDGPIGQRQFYFDQTSGTYYRKEPYSLRARWNNQNQIQILIPNLATSHTTHFELARCACVRDINENLKATLVANSIAQYTKSNLSPEICNIEDQRLMITNSPAMSSVDTLLKSHTVYDNNEKRLLNPSQIYPLYDDQASQSPDDQSNWHGWTNPAVQAPVEQSPMDSSLVTNRNPRLAGLSIGTGLLLKAAAFSAPYILDKQKDILNTFAKEVKGSFLLDSGTNRNWSAQSLWQDNIDFSLKDAPVNIHFQPDGINLELKDNVPELQKYSTPNIQLAQFLEKTGEDLSFVRKNIFPGLPELLLEHVMPRLQYPIRPQSRVLVEIEKAASFWKVKFLFECQRTDLDYTEVKVETLPHAEREGVLYKAKVPADQLAVSQTNQPTKHNDVTIQQKECADLLLSHSPQNILAACGEVQYESRVVTELFSLSSGSLWLIAGPAKLTHQCSSQTGVTLLLPKHFTVVYISASCDFSITHLSLHFQHARSSKLQSRTPVFRILQYDAPAQVSDEEWRIIWLSLVTALTMLTMLVLLGLAIKLVAALRSHPWWPLISAARRSERPLSVRPPSPEPPYTLESPVPPVSQVPMAKMVIDQQEEISNPAIQEFHNSGAGAKYNLTCK